MFRIGIDVGGTFTDLVSIDAAGHINLAKVPTTPADQSLGVMQGLAGLAATLGLELGAMLARTERLAGLALASFALFTVLALGNGVSTVLECGGGLCPDNPTGYLLLQ